MRDRQKGQIQHRARTSTVLSKRQFIYALKYIRLTRHVRIWVEDSAAGLLASNGLIL